MSGLILSPIGLVLAAALSVGNVCADIARKKVMEHHELIAGTFWIRAFAALVFTLALAIRTLTGTSSVIRNSGFLFGISGLSIAPLAAFLPPQGLPPAATKALPTSPRESIRGNRCGSVSDCFLKKATWANKPTVTSYAQSDYWRSHG